MEKATLVNLIPNTDELIKKIEDEKTKKKTDITKFLKEFNPKEHDIHDKSKRQDKTITDENENLTTIPVARLSIPMQKRIVNLSASFLCANPITLSAAPKDEAEKNLLDLVTRVWNDLKLRYDSQEIARIMMSETEVAELWYIEDAEQDYWDNSILSGTQFKARMRIIANSKGDTLYPVFNSAGDLIAFGRQYELKMVDGTKEEHFDLYTDDNIVLNTKANGVWLQEIKTNILRKIPVIYYSQLAPEWHDVQEMIDRFEKSISNHGDTNDYYGSPMVKVKGKIKGFAKKGESGKVLELEPNAEADYMTWDQSPESVKLEQQNLRSLILDFTDTPDISFDNMKGMGTFSGFALKMLFMAAHLKASQKEETFGKSIQRRINLIKAILVAFNESKLKPGSSVDIQPVFDYFLPKDEQGAIDLLVAATGNKPVLSRKTAVSLNPLVKDATQELQQLKEEQKEDNTLDMQFNQ